MVALGKRWFSNVSQSKDYFTWLLEYFSFVTVYHGFLPCFQGEITSVTNCWQP